MSEPVDFRELFGRLGCRPRMFLPDDRFNTAAGFVEGCNVATGGVLLRGFSEWVSVRILGHATNFHWSAVIAAQYRPDGVDASWDGSSAPALFHKQSFDELIAQLDAFLEHTEDGREL